jgi:hypothetical protein
MIESEYDLARAAECLRRADGAHDVTDKVAWAKLAESWFRLASVRADQQQRRPAGSGVPALW